MDFAFDESQQAVSQSAEAVFGGIATDERVAEVEQSEDRFDERLWSELARANLLGLSVPEEDGGSGLGLTETCLVLEQQGRTVAPVPLWATVVLGALPIARWGSEEQRRAMAPAGRVRGRQVVGGSFGRGLVQGIRAAVSRRCQTAQAGG